MNSIMIDRDQLLQVLMLIIQNDSTSASTPGLKRRAENRKKIKVILLNVLSMSEEEAEEMYVKKLEEES